MALSKQGIVFTWGINDFGQLGHGNEINCYEPQPVKALNRPIWRIDCGLKHCLALSKDSILYAWGSNLQS